METCPRCGAPLEPADSAGAPRCARCLFELALEAKDLTEPTPEEAKPSASQPPADGIAEPPHPSQVGPYHLISVLGSGGMGVVYLAEQESPLRRRVALKLIRHGLDTVHTLRRFDTERQALALMTHPGITRVLDAGADVTGRPYFVMELVEGVSITEYCDQHRLPTAARLALFIDVCAAVQHAHQKGIIHRDLKPSNIMVIEEDGSPVPKIIDFGVAKALEQRLTEATLFTELGVILGTPEYMSPEQADARAMDIDTRTDVYALGVILYELLVGALPFDGTALRRAGYDEIRRVIREVDPPTPSARLSALGAAAADEVAHRRQTDIARLRHQLRGDLDAISVKAMEKDRARRYASVSELAADIQRHLDNEPVVARPLSGIHRLRKTLGKHKALVRTLAAVFGILLLATIVSTLMYLRAQRARSDTQRQVVKLAVANGNRLAEEGDPAVALLWFARALPLAEGRDLEMLHIRITSALENTPKIALLLPHDAPLLRAQYVSGEREILTVAEDAARLWDAATGEIRQIFGGHQTPLVAASLNGATRRLLTADRAGTLQLWDTHTGIKVGVAVRHGGELKFADFNPAGSLIVTAGAGGARIWEVATGRLIRVLAHPDGAHHAIFSPDGRLLATAGPDGVRVWNLTTGDLTTHVAQLLNDLHRLAFSPRGDRLFIPGHSGALLDTASSRLIVATLGHRMETTKAAFSSGGRFGVTASGDTTARIFDAQSGTVLAGPLLHDDMVSAAGFNRENEYAGRVITGTFGGVVRVWDVGGRAWTPWLRHSGEITSVELTSNGRHLLTASRDRLVRVWDLVAGLEPYRTFARSALGSRSIVRSDYSVYWFPSMLSRDRRRVLAGGNCRSPTRPCYAELWDIEAGEPLTPRLFHKSLMTAVALSPDGSKVASSSSDRTIRIWDATTGEPLAVLPIDGAASSLRFSPDSSRLVAAAGYWALPPAFSDARVWDVTTGRALWSVRQGRVIWATDFDPSGQFVATSGEDYQVILREAGTGRVVGAPLVHPSRVSHLAFSADGRKLLTSGEDGGVRLWDVARQKLVLPPLMHTSTIISANFSPDEQAIVVATEGGTAQLWDIQTGRPRTPVLKHRGLVYSASVSTDGRFLVTGSLDRTTRAWDASTGEPLTPPLQREGLIRSSLFLRGTGEWLVVGFGLGIASLPLAQPVPEQLETIATLLAAQRLGERGELMALSAADLSSAWQRQGGSRPALPTPRQLDAWQRRKASQDDWQETLRYLNAAIATQTTPSTSLVALRGEAHAELGQWKEAVHDFVIARRQQRWNTEVGYWLALAELRSGDEVASRRTVAELFAESAGTRNAHRAIWLARALSLHPDGPHAINAEPLAALMFDIAPGELDVLETYAAALLRNGAVDQAIARVKQAIDVDQRHPNVWQAALLALAYRHQGRRAEARRVLRAAGDDSADANRPLSLKRQRLANEAPGATDNSTRWWQRVETELFLREAEALRVGPPKLTQREPGVRISATGSGPEP